MSLEITVKNYRCFSDSVPMRITLGNGFTSFIGVNNSGKSSVLKFFYEFRPLFKRLASDVDDGILDESYAEEVIDGVKDKQEVFHNGNERPLIIDFTFPDLTGILQGLHITVTLERGLKGRYVASMRYGGIEVLRPQIRVENGVVSGNGQYLFERDKLKEEFQHLGNTFYIGSFRNALAATMEKIYFDMEVGKSLISRWRMLKNGGTQDGFKKVRDITETIRSAFNYDSLQIDTLLDDSEFFLQVNGQPFRLSELGSGLAQFIIVATNLATSSQRPYALIDEPELGLHPTLQQAFVQIIGQYVSRGVLFSTHSIGLARSTSEHMYALRVDKDKNHEITLFESLPRLAEFLGEIGFSAYQDLGYEQLLLVEGPTEVKTFQQLLRKYSKDSKVVVVSLGGASLINGDAKTELQLSELLRICPTIAAIVDSERNSNTDSIPTERSNFQAICKKLNIICHILDRRAIENYWTVKAIQQVKGQSYRELAQFDRLKNVQPSWSKDENWKIAAQMDRQDIDTTDLGHFLKQL
jgi:predicted ATPase